MLTDPVDQSDTPRPNSMSLIVPRGAFNYSSTKCESVLTLIDEGLTSELADRIDSHKDHLNFGQSLCFAMQLVIETKVLRIENKRQFCHFIYFLKYSRYCKIQYTSENVFT